MSHNPLIVGAMQRAALAGLRYRAAETPIDVRAVIERCKTPEGKRAHLAEMARLTIDIPVAYAVSFSIEAGHPCGTVRHMSMSSGRRGKAPTQQAVFMIAEELGFIGGGDACMVYPEQLSDGIAINVIQPLTVHGAGSKGDLL